MRSPVFMHVGVTRAPGVVLLVVCMLLVLLHVVYVARST